jgi:hypothetical protein
VFKHSYCGFLDYGVCSLVGDFTVSTQQGKIIVFTILNIFVVRSLFLFIPEFGPYYNYSQYLPKNVNSIQLRPISVIFCLKFEAREFLKPPQCLRNLSTSCS